MQITPRIWVQNTPRIHNTNIKPHYSIYDWFAQVTVGGRTVLVAQASQPRPDLVPKVTSNPDHGFHVQLPAAATAVLQCVCHS